MKKKKYAAYHEPSSTPVTGQPENCAEQINKYGTYEIQPTCDSDNEYPAIAQGYPKIGRRNAEQHTPGGELQP